MKGRVTSIVVVFGLNFVVWNSGHFSRFRFFLHKKSIEYRPLKYRRYSILSKSIDIGESIGCEKVYGLAIALGSEAEKKKVPRIVTLCNFYHLNFEYWWKNGTQGHKPGIFVERRNPVCIYSLWPLQQALLKSTPFVLVSKRQLSHALKNTWGLSRLLPMAGVLASIFSEIGGSWRFGPQPPKKPCQTGKTCKRYRHE